MRMKIFATALLGLSVSLFSAEKSQAQAASEEKLSLNLSLNHDAFFGFNPMVSGAIKGKKESSFTFYGIQWGAGTASAWGNWTEFGVGVNFPAGEFININPQLGFTMGNLLSSFTTGRGAVGDGIVPNVTINLSSTKLEGQIYGGYYGAFRKEGPSTANYVHYWANLGTKVSKNFSFGAHFENLFRQGGKNQPTSNSNYYTWVGPYVQFSKGSAGLRLSAGGNLASDEAIENYNGDFYKLQFFFGL